MTEPYEFVEASPSGFTGQTFGCSCCSTRKELGFDKAKILETLKATAEMYSRLASRYFRMYWQVIVYGPGAVCEALAAYEALKRNRLAYQAAKEHLANPGSAGEFGEKSAQIGLNTLFYRTVIACECFTITQQIIVQAFTEVKNG